MRNVKLGFFLGAIASFFPATLGRAGTAVFVDDDAPPAGDGLSWATAYQFLQDALTATRNSGGAITEIWVAAGTYQPDRDAAHPAGTQNRSASFQLIDDVALRGGFAGNEDPSSFDLAHRDFQINRSVLSGDLLGNDGPNFANNGDNANTIVMASNLGLATILDGFTVSGARNGAMSNGNANPTITNCTFTGNAAINSYGGGMSNGTSSPTLTNCTFSGNWCSTKGGGIYNLGNSNPTLSNCTFTGNSAMNGGGIYNAYYSFGPAPTLTNCTFTANSTSYGSGGGMYNEYRSHPVLINCRFSGNSSVSYGGGMYNESDSQPTLTGCAFTGNSAEIAGGLTNDSKMNITLTNCTFTANTASGTSPGIAGGISTSGVGTMALVNCIVWGNTAPNVFYGTPPQILGSPTITYSCIQDGSTGTGNIKTNPRLVLTPDGNFLLRRGSPCIDAGNSAAVPAAVTIDMIGSPRFVDDPDTPDTGNPASPPGPMVDMGATEYAPVPARRLYVKADAAPGGDGLSWSTAYQFLQDAFAAAQPDHRVSSVWLAAGIYRPDRDAAHPAGTGSRGATFQLIDGVALYGGFPGAPGQEDIFSVRDPVMYVTVLSGDLAGNDEPNFANNSENSYQVVSALRVDTGAIVDGFTISGGNQGGSSSHGGGGIYCSGGGPVFANCTISGNRSGFFGGGMYNSSSSPVLTNCTFTGNAVAGSLASGAGGAIYNFESSPTLTNCRFFGHSRIRYGGGIYNTQSSSPTLIGCLFNGNSAGSGGGMYSEFSSNPTLTTCLFDANSAHEGGGMYSVSNSNPTLVNCAFSANSANGNGGGMFGNASTSKLTNCTFRGNSASAGYGGGIANFSNSNWTITNCTFAGNSAGPGPGISGSCTLTNCILWGNVGLYGQIFNAGTVSYSCIQGGWSGTGNINSDPLFLGTGNLRLSPGSPCIDAGRNAAVPAGILTDLDGHPRFTDDPATEDCQWALGTCGAAPIVDMGAYEFIPPRSILQWRSVRSHGASGPLAIAIIPAAGGNGPTGPAVESRQGGVQLIEVDFSGAVTLSNPAGVTVMGRTTDGGGLGSAVTYVPTLISLADVDTLQISFAPDLLPDQTCYTISFAPGTFVESLSGDLDAQVRSLFGDASGDGRVNLSDALLIRSKAAPPTGSSSAPQCDIDHTGSDICLADAMQAKTLIGSPLRQALCP